MHPICTQRNLFGILLNQTEIRLYISFSGWFGAKRLSVWFQINQKIAYTFRFRFDSIIIQKHIPVCIYKHPWHSFLACQENSTKPSTQTQLFPIPRKKFLLGAKSQFSDLLKHLFSFSQYKFTLLINRTISSENGLK